MSENIQQDRTDIWMRPTPQQPDSLTTGSKRLARSFVSPPDGKNCISVKDWVIDLVKADPGIVALVEHAKWCNTHGTDDEAADRGLAALKLWETGK